MCRLVCLDLTRLTQARTELQGVEWITYEPLLYQVLALAVAKPIPESRPRTTFAPIACTAANRPTRRDRSIAPTRFGGSS